MLWLFFATHQQKFQLNLLRYQSETFKQKLLWLITSKSYLVFIPEAEQLTFDNTHNVLILKPTRKKAKQNKPSNNWHCFLGKKKHLPWPFSNIFGSLLISCTLVRLSFTQLHWYMALSSHSPAPAPDGERHCKLASSLACICGKRWITGYNSWRNLTMLEAGIELLSSFQ